MGKVVYKSNGGAIGDGYRQARISMSGQKLEIMTDTKAGTYSEVILVADVIVPPPPPPPPPVDPVDPPATGTVTPATFAAALAAAKGGDALVLTPGEYVMPRGLKFTTPVTIKGGTFARMSLSGAQGIIFDGTTFDYRFKAGDTLQGEPFAVVGCSDLTFKNCLFDGDVASGTNTAADGFGIGRGLSIKTSDKVTVDGCTFKSWMRGLMVSGSTNIRVLRNTVFDIRSDGMNFIQVQDVIIEGNTIRDFRSAPNSGDHADMIQFWTTGTTKPSANIIIRGNLLDMAQGTWAQSLFMRNEIVDNGLAGPEMFYQNVLIENNTVRNAHVHGITVGESNGIIVRNNSVKAAQMNLDNAYNAAYFAKYGAGAGIMTPKIFVSDKSTNVTIEANTLGAA